MDFYLGGICDLCNNNKYKPSGYYILTSHVGRRKPLFVGKRFQNWNRNLHQIHSIITFPKCKWPKPIKKYRFFNFILSAHGGYLILSLTGVLPSKTDKNRIFRLRNRRFCISFLHREEVCAKKLYKIGIDFLVIVL